MSDPPLLPYSGRISMDPNDRGYKNLKGAISVRVLLDGVAQTYVVTADTEEGFVRRAKRTLDGNYFVTDQSGENFLYERVFGKVEMFIISSAETSGELQ